MNQQYPPGQYPGQRPPQRPQRPQLTPEERRRRQEYHRRMKQKQMQKRLTILVVAVLFIILTVILIAVALHRSTAPTGTQTEPPQQTDAPDTPAQIQTTLPESTAPPVSGRGITICIDPGHGYDDNGASSPHLGDVTEKDVTLAIGLKLRELLLDAGFAVIMTHDTNEIPADAPPGEQYLFGLAKRTAFANERMPDLYISIHGDSYEDSSVNGSRVYFQTLTGQDNDAITAIGQKFVDALTIAFPTAKLPLLKPMEDDTAYYVLRNTNMPAVLIEVGFATNPTDAANMLNPDWQQKMAEAMAAGVDMIFPA